MSTSRHPIALRFERAAGGSTRLLATVMALPLVDGIFPALVIAGALTGPGGSADPVGIAETGLLIFGGSATVAVVLAEMDGTPREKAASVLALGAVLIPLAVIEAALAQTIESMLSPVFHRFAGLVILAVAAKTASAEVGEYLPRPGAIIALGLVASFDPTGFEFDVSLRPELLASAAAAAGVGVAFALAVALAGDRLRDHVDIDRFRFGSAVALGMLALTVTDLLATRAPVALGVLCVTAVFSYDPGSAASDDDGAPDAAEASAGRPDASTDGGASGIDPGDVPADADRDPDAGSESDPDTSTDSGSESARAPWL